MFIFSFANGTHAIYPDMFVEGHLPDFASFPSNATYMSIFDTENHEILGKYKNIKGTWIKDRVEYNGQLYSSNEPYGWAHMYVAHMLRYCGAETIGEAVACLHTAIEKARSYRTNRINAWQLSDLECVLATNSWWLSEIELFSIQDLDASALENWLAQ